MVSIIRRQKEREPAKAETEHDPTHHSCSLLLLLLLLLLVLYRLLLAIFRYEAFSQNPQEPLSAPFAFSSHDTRIPNSLQQQPGAWVASEY
jgi:hypothetical protein